MIEIRDVSFADYPAISKLHADSWRQNYRGILSDNFLDNKIEQFHLDTWYNRLKSPKENQYTTIATVDKNIAGFSCFLLDDDALFGSLLDNLHVSNNMQQAGIGKLLMKNCAKTICDKCDNHKMYLWVYELNENARKIYEHLGGTKFETIEKQNVDETTAMVCRYIWNDVSIII